MVRIIDQNIPAELLERYKASLRQSTDWKPGANIYTARKRQPFRLPHMQSNNGNSPSGEQLEVREAFKKCVDCYNASPKTGGATPPDIGYRSREWWHTAAAGSGLWYYDYFIQQTWQTYFNNEIPDWCVGPILDCEIYGARYKMGYGKDDNQAIARQESWDDWLGKSWGSTSTQQFQSHARWVKHPWPYYRYYKYVWQGKYRIDLTTYSPAQYSSALLVIIPETIPLFDEYYCPYSWTQDSRNIITDITSHLGTMYEPDIYFPDLFANFWSDVDSDYMGYKAFPKVYLTLK